ncbi:MAG: zinc-binding alcohol dehydrogenase family protein [Pseudomonadota bacterium]
MKAFTYHTAHALDQFSLALQTVAQPALQPTDLRVQVKAFSFNPVDYKIRQSRSAADGVPVILGWDAAGIVEAVGANVTGFAPGDAVYYAGEFNRSGSYAQQQLVDYRLAAHKPASLDFADAAALPLTAVTAYEALFERNITYTADSHVLVIGGAGGVGSMAVQWLKALTPATVIATATRPDTIAWVKQMGADHVIGRDLPSELARLGIPALDVIFSTTHTKDYLSVIPQLLRPFGHLAVIDDPETLDIRPFKTKALSVHWEYMFSKAMYGYMPETQGATLAQLATLVDAARIKTTRTKTLSATVENLRLAHETLEHGTAFGKWVMAW